MQGVFSLVMLLNVKILEDHLPYFFKNKIYVGEHIKEITTTQYLKLSGIYSVYHSV
jgi:hypothetical protein